MLAALDTRLEEQPDDPVALDRLASIRIRNGSPEKAVRAYEQALKHSPKSSRLLSGLAMLYWKQLHDPQKAMDQARNAYKLAPEDANVLSLLGRLAYSTGDFKWAVSLLEQSARRKTPEPELSFDLAMACYSVGRVADAQAAANSALQLNEAFSRASEARLFLELVALSSAPAGALEAEDRVRQILETDPTNVPALMVLGRAAETRNDTVAATNAYEQALKRHPDFTPAARRLALLLAEKLGSEKQACELAIKVREATPGDTEMGRVLGLVSFRRGDFRKAVQYLKESIGQETTDGPALCYLGLAHYRLNEKRESREALVKALELNPPTPLADEARRALAELK
jgi:Flp pilus assembly protein TadD